MIKLMAKLLSLAGVGIEVKKKKNLRPLKNLIGSIFG